MGKSTQLILQILLVISSVCVALILSRVNHEDQHEQTSLSSSSFDMLKYLDDRIASQECRKDVRCWSSVSKFQMFAAGANIDHDAQGVRIEQYNRLLDEIWKEASLDVKSQISAQQLVSVLTRRFPGRTDAETGEVTFVFPNSDSPYLVMKDLADDYSDTIESWRLLQSWASQKVDESGKPILSPAYSQEAIDEFQSFLTVFDLALLKHAKEIAARNKLSVIDARSMESAFNTKPSQY